MILIQGNKKQIAKRLLQAIPPAEHFYDLFGGGGSMTEVAITTNKWSHVHYNELQQGLYQLMKEVWEGTFDIHKAETTWISREDFKKFKDEPTAWGAWVKYGWSFSGCGSAYLYTPTFEVLKYSLFIIFTQGMDWLPSMCMHEKQLLWQKVWRYASKLYGIYRHGVSSKDGTPYKRSGEVNSKCNMLDIIYRTPKLFEFDYTRLQTSCGDYRNVEILPNSVVYCDIPYGKGSYYTEPFDRQAFLDWAATRLFPVYISEYNIDDARFQEVLSILKHKGNIISTPESNKGYSRVEKLYWNGVGVRGEELGVRS